MNPVPDTPPASPGPRPACRYALVLVLLVAAAVRLPGLDQAPPGLHQDEAANAWNAWCLLKTGQDQHGQRWPIFCMRALGEFRSTLYAYVIIPFQALGGMSVWTTRLPAALGGVLMVLLLYATGTRLFDRETGLAAAAVLAIDPTHIQLSRLGHEATLAPLLCLLPVLLLLWAGLPIGDTAPQPRAGRALLAGLIIGAGCYGYPAVRLFVPALLLACLVVTARAWWRMLQTRRGVLGAAALSAGLAATLGPLTWKHVREPEVIAKRAATTWIWSASDASADRAAKVARRYAAHFQPRFLFADGDADETIWTVPRGFLPAYMLPLLVLGLVWAVPAAPRSRSVRVLLAGVALFPIADAFNWHVSLHALRTSAGLWPLVLLAGLGIRRTAGLLHARRQQAATVAACIALLALVLPALALFGRQYFVQRPRTLPVWYGTHMDLLAACDWLRPRLRETDTVVCFASGPNPGYTPWLITLVALQHDPHAWLSEPREADLTGKWDRQIRYGRFYFLHGDERARWEAERTSGQGAGRVFLLLRPDESGPGEPCHVIDDPAGQPAVVVREAILSAHSSQNRF